MNPTAIRIDQRDNVAVALTPLQEGDLVSVDGNQLSVVAHIKAKHKIALQDFNMGEAIIMYGFEVGRATKSIQKGALIHTQNVQHSKSNAKVRSSNYNWTPPDVKHWESKTFMGYHRADGQVGTANVWLFFPLVFCENRNIAILKEVFESELGITKQFQHRHFLRNLVEGKDHIDQEIDHSSNRVFPNVHPRFITHQGGCGGTREDAVLLAKLLAGYVNNPNVAGATVLSLGCQNLQIEIFKEALNDINPNNQKPIHILDQQEQGTTDALIKNAIKQSYESLKEANAIERKPAPLSKLTLGLECGGSDGFSGVSANPVLGRVSDMLVALGGSAVLAEFPELCGVEQQLIDRCENTTLASRFLKLMQDFERSAIDAGSGFDMNPSPGNIKDGLITDAMKSAGAAKKGGAAPIAGVLDYTEYCHNQGLHLLCTPGNDVESTTALVGSGCNLVAFTTGLGTPTGNPAAPVIKMSSNNNLAQKMKDIIDFNAGGVITGEESLEDAADRLLSYMVDVASGRIQTQADKNQQFDFIPWKRGVSL